MSTSKHIWWEKPPEEKEMAWGEQLWLHRGMLMGAFTLMGFSDGTRTGEKWLVGLDLRNNFQIVCSWNRALREMRNFSAKLSPTLVNWSLNLVGTKSRNCCFLGYQPPAGPATCDRIFPLETQSWFFFLFLWLLFYSPLLITHSALELQLIYSLYFISAESVSIDLTAHQCLSGSWDIISYLNCSQDVSTWLALSSQNWCQNQGHLLPLKLVLPIPVLVNILKIETIFKTFLGCLHVR